ncbi:MAG: hypothetical protein U0136_19700 [Bdellovibrionota bacterium]
MKTMTSALLRNLSASALLLLVSLLSNASAEETNPCSKHEAHDSVTFLLVDRSDKLPNLEGLKQTLQAVKEMIQPGERLMVGTSGGKLSETRIILDVVRPKSSVWESVLKTRARDKAFERCFEAMEATVLKQDEQHKTSAILETLSFVSSNVGSDAAPKKRVVLYSDMVQNSSELTFYGPKPIDPAVALQKADKENWVVKLPATDVYVSGAGTTVPDDKAKKIEDFWRKYFDKSGAQLKFYGPVFVGS